MTTSPNGTRLVGKWARTMPDRKFGFINADGHDYFLHESNLEAPDDLSELQAGDTLSFVPCETPKGLRAEEARREMPAPVRSVPRHP